MKNSRNSSKNSTLALMCGLYLLLPSFMEASPRSQFGDVAATAMEEFVGQVAPGETLEWASRVWLISGERRTEVLFPGLAQQPMEGGWLFVTGFAFPTPEGKPGTVATLFPQVVVLRADTLGKLVGSRLGVFDQQAREVRLTNIQIGGMNPRGWPTLEIRYRGIYGSEDLESYVDWTAVIDAELMAVKERLPLQIKKAVPGGKPVVDRVRTRRVAAGIELRGVTRPTVVKMPCAEQCVIQGPSLLADWPTEP